MRDKRAQDRRARGKPAKRVSAVKKKRTGPGLKYYGVRSWWILRGAALGLAALGLLYGAWIGFGKVLELESLSVRIIEVEGCRAVAPETIRKLSGVAEGEPLLRVDLRDVRRKVMRHPVVRDAAVVRQLPHTLRISVRERSPVAVVMGGEFALVDDEGVVLEVTGVYPEGYPLITGAGQVREPGGRMGEVKPALGILAGLLRSGLVGPEKVSELRLDGRKVRVFLVEGGTALVMEHGGTEAQLSRLARLEEAGFFDTSAASYDLRFDGRVIEIPDREGYAGGEGAAPAGG